jgi:hypothetical protein
VRESQQLCTIAGCCCCCIVLCKQRHLATPSPTHFEHHSVCSVVHTLDYNCLLVCCNSVCAIIKGEATYLPEWIDYHSHLGVGQFYLYDNGPGPEVTRLISSCLLETFTTAACGSCCMRIHNSNLHMVLSVFLSLMVGHIVSCPNATKLNRCEQTTLIVRG